VHGFEWKATGKATIRTFQILVKGGQNMGTCSISVELDFRLEFLAESGERHKISLSTRETLIEEA